LPAILDTPSSLETLAFYAAPSENDAMGCIEAYLECAAKLVERAPDVAACLGECGMDWPVRAWINSERTYAAWARGQFASIVDTDGCRYSSLCPAELEQLRRGDEPYFFTTLRHEREGQHVVHYLLNEHGDVGRVERSASPRLLRLDVLGDRLAAERAVVRGIGELVAHLSPSSPARLKCDGYGVVWDPGRAVFEVRTPVTKWTGSVSDVRFAGIAMKSVQLR
jgi:hypothetical protein